ncbi:MAG: hypothetical protein H7336_10670 [Bacteriovorax sp.]|nr:hypothetical protein [Bacteriovorax sp.]
MQLTKVLPLALSILALSTLLNASEAKESLLCVVTSDLDSDTAKLTYEMDEDGRKITHLWSEKWVNNKLAERTEMQMQDLLGDGVILNKKDKYVTVRLYSHNFDDERGGVLYLDTLYNAVNGQRKEYMIEVSKNVNNEIEMANNKVMFNRMKFIAKKSPILGPIGIEKVNFSK